MPYSASDFMCRGAPVGDFCRLLNDSFEAAYESNRDEYGPRVSKYGFATAPRERWGLDLSRVRCSGSTWAEALPEVQDHVLYHVVRNAIDNSSRLGDFFPGDVAEERRDDVARNLSNAWRDEFALNDPVDADARGRMRTTEWRIAMCYYAVFKAQSALMHCAFEDIRADGGEGSHARMWIKHRREVMTPLGNSLYAFPFMYFPQATTGEHASNWFDWTVPYPVPDGTHEKQQDVQDHREMLRENAREALQSLYEQLQEFEWTNEAGLNTFYDALLMLRQWANYQHGGVFGRLYGTGYVQAIDEALRLVTFAGLAIAEVGVVAALGWDRFSEVWEVFATNASAGLADSSAVAARRVDVYRRAFS